MQLLEFTHGNTMDKEIFEMIKSSEAAVVQEYICGAVLCLPPANEQIIIFGQTVY
jgi:hypothetical protein